MRAYQLPKGGAGIDALVKIERPNPKPSFRQVLVDDNFFRLTLALSGAGMGPAEIVGTLESEARFGRSPNERESQISTIIDGLKRKRINK